MSVFHCDLNTCVYYCDLFRNIIEREHKALVDRRHTHFSATDKATLAQFRQAKDGEWQKERQQTRHGQQLRPAVLIAIFFAVFFCGLVLIAVSTDSVRNSSSRCQSVIIPS